LPYNLAPLHEIGIPLPMRLPSRCRRQTRGYRP